MESPTGSPTSHAIDHDSLVYRISHNIGRPWHFQISQPLIQYNMLCRRPHLNRMVMKQHMVERPIVDLFTLHLKACDHTNSKWPYCKVALSSDERCTILPPRKQSHMSAATDVDFICKRNPHLNLTTKHIAILSSCTCLWNHQPHSPCLPLQYWCIFPTSSTMCNVHFPI